MYTNENYTHIINYYARTAAGTASDRVSALPVYSDRNNK